MIWHTGNAPPCTRGVFAYPVSRELVNVYCSALCAPELSASLRSQQSKYWLREGSGSCPLRDEQGPKAAQLSYTLSKSASHSETCRCIRTCPPWCDKFTSLVCFTQKPRQIATHPTSVALCCR